MARSRGSAPRSLALVCAVAALVAAAPARADHPAAKTSAVARDARGAERALTLAARLREGRGVRNGRELSPALADLAARLPALRGAERRRAEALFARPTDGAADVFGDGYAVAEATPYDTPSFRIHYVTATADAPPPADENGNGVPDYVETMGAEFETTRAVENGQLGWRPPVPDGTLGGDARTDVYIKQLGNQGLFGYAAADPNQVGASRQAFLVMDNDYAQSEYPNYADFRAPLQVTAAHEYNHVLHNALDGNQDFWLFESTAVWMEDQVYDGVNDYFNYLPAPRWVAQTRIPLTQFDQANASNPANIKVYGDAVWAFWLSARFGPDVVRTAWEGSLGGEPASFGPGAEDRAIRSRGGAGFASEFVSFAAAVAEWRTQGGAFAESAELPFPDVERVGSLSPSAPSVQTTLDHTTFALLDVPPSSGPIALAGVVAPGLAGGIALVGRIGPEGTGTVVVRAQPLARGGRGRVTLAPGSYSRVTAVLVNADFAQNGFDNQAGDWDWTGDAACASASISQDGTRPTMRLRSKAKGAPLGGNVVADFSEPVHCADARGVRLVAPGGEAVPAAVTYDAARRRVTLDPAGKLLDSVRYRLVPAGVVDRGGNGVVRGATVETVRRKPIFLLSGPSSQRGGDVARRGLRVTLRSSDRERVRWSLRVEGPGGASAARVVGRRSGSLRPKGTVRVRVKLDAATRRALASGRRLRLTVRAAVTDPQRNVARKTRRVSLRP